MPYAEILWHFYLWFIQDGYEGELQGPDGWLLGGENYLQLNIQDERDGREFQEDNGKCLSPPPWDGCVEAELF